MIKQLTFLTISILIAAQPVMVSASINDRYRSNFESVIKPISKHAQNNQFRSKHAVMRMVEQQYNAEVLKIRLDRQAQIYRVRILQANGKVKSISVNALK